MLIYFSISVSEDDPNFCDPVLLDPDVVSYRIDSHPSVNIISKDSIAGPTFEDSVTSHQRDKNDEFFPIHNKRLITHSCEIGGFKLETFYRHDCLMSTDDVGIDLF